MKLDDIKQISIIGLGYVGLVTALCLASKGYMVRGVDTSPEIVKSLNHNKIPFHEPQLNDLLKTSLKSKSFTASNDVSEVIQESKLVFISVDTPANPDGGIDLTSIKKVSQDLGAQLDDTFRIITVRSTVIPGTTDGVILPILERESNLKAGVDFGLCVNPEFLREGSAVNDFLHPDRIIIGYLDSSSGDFLEQLYEPFSKNIFKTNLRTAEMIKYTNNAFLATKVSFINEIANICRLTEGIDVMEVAHGIGMDERISSLFLRAGCGFGGSCFPKDLRGLIHFAKEHHYSPILLEATLRLNDFQARYLIDLALSEIASLENKKIAILGLAFKPNTSDMREAVSIRVINRLLQYKTPLSVYDPVAIPNTRAIFGSKLTYCSSIEDCLKDADVCFVITEWDEFKSLTPGQFKSLMKTPVIIDGRKIYDVESFSKEVTLIQIGFKPIS